MTKYEELGKGGVLRRREPKVLGVFIDGVGLDRATRRLNRKVELSRLVKGVTSGTPPTLSRYYTIIPNDDDSRQRAYLDAVARAGLKVIVKRLPPKGINRQVGVEVEMASDIIAFALGAKEFEGLSEYGNKSGATSELKPSPVAGEKRVVTVVCPSRELSYAIALVRELGVDTITADFGQFATGDVLKSATKWIDLSDSETIWRE